MRQVLVVGNGVNKGHPQVRNTLVQGEALTKTALLVIRPSRGCSFLLRPSDLLVASLSILI